MPFTDVCREKIHCIKDPDNITEMNILHKISELCSHSLVDFLWYKSYKRKEKIKSLQDKFSCLLFQKRSSEHCLRRRRVVVSTLARIPRYFRKCASIWSKSKSQFLIQTSQKMCENTTRKWAIFCRHHHDEPPPWNEIKCSRRKKSLQLRTMMRLVIFSFCSALLLC